jgi:hypothetical protein
MPAKPPRRARPRRLAFGAPLALALLAAAAAGGHALLWLRICDRLEEGFAAWAANRRAEGWRVEHGTPLRGGWPSAAVLTVPAFRLQRGADLPPPGDGGVDWRAEALALRVSPPRLDRLVVEAPGRHRLRLGGAALVFTADRLDVALPIERNNDGAPPREAVGAARRLRFDTPAGAAEIRAASLDFETRGAATGGSEPAAAALRLSAADATLPPGLPGVDRLGRAVERIGLDLLMTGPVPPPGLGDPARRAAAWRDGGGALEIRALDGRWGEAVASASATLVLDGALQPAGTGTLRLAGGDALLDAASEAGLLPPFGAAAARVALRALERRRAPPAENGPAAGVELPLALRNRSLSVGGVPLARLPALDWAATGPGAAAKP